MHKWAAAIVFYAFIVWGAITILNGPLPEDTTPCQSVLPPQNEFRIHCLMNTITTWGNIKIDQNVFVGFISAVKAPAEYFFALFKLMTYDSSAIDGSFEVVRYILFSPIYAAFGFGIISIFWLAFRYTL